MLNKDRIAIRAIFYIVGLAIMTFGVTISVKSGLGVTPISSVPYTATVVLGVDLGISTMIFSIVMVLLQILVLRKQYKLRDLLQLPIGIAFGACLTASGHLLDVFPDPQIFAVRLLLVLISTVFIAFGVFLYVSAGFVPLAPEGFIIAIARVTKKSFANVKVISDITMVTLSMVTCLLAVHSLGSIGIGTVIAAILVGTEVKFITKKFGRHRDRILGKNI